MPFFLNSNTRLARAKYSHNVVARHSRSICRQTLVPPSLFLRVTIPPPLPISPPLVFIFLVPPVPFPSFYRLRALVVRDVLLSIHMTDPAAISFLSPHLFSHLFFSVGRYHIFTPPSEHDGALRSCFLPALVFYPISRNDTMLQSTNHRPFCEA